jgi:60 kDa SS-A/Ro ribonucleoprotein
MVRNDYLIQAVTPNQTPQSVALPGQVKNNAGGHSFPVDEWDRLDRFLILGSSGGTYYVGERDLTTQNVNNILALITSNGERVVSRVVDISVSGRAPKNDPALFVLALCVKHGTPGVKAAALDALLSVARIGTHLFTFVGFLRAMSVKLSGRMLRTGLGNWYQSKYPATLAYQLIKYQSREGWSHADILRLAHPRPVDTVHSTLYGWAIKGWESVGEQPHPDKALVQVWAFERAKRAKTAREIVELITQYELPREAIPTQFLNDVTVWDALLQSGRGMPMTALIRNLGKMSAIGLLGPNSKAVAFVQARLRNAEIVKQSRLHPLAVLQAQHQYREGRGLKGLLTWNVSQAVVGALGDAFYLAFGNVPTTGLRYNYALDTSGSMVWPPGPAGLQGIDCREASACMALVLARREPQHLISAFDSAYHDMPITPHTSIAEAINIINRMAAVATDCAIPMRTALARRVPVDVFVIFTDNETGSAASASRNHPVEALREYRQKMGIPAKLVVVVMNSNGFTIADPNDGGMLDVVGFDTATPSIIADFATGGAVAAASITED